MNYLAILVCAIINMIIGTLWYSPFLFGNIWAKLMGFEKRNQEEVKKAIAQKSAFTFLGAIFTAFILELFIKMMAIQTVYGGFRTGFLAWLGFAATAQFTNWVFSGKKIDLFIINTTYPLVVYCLTGALLAIWK